MSNASGCYGQPSNKTQTSSTTIRAFLSGRSIDKASAAVVADMVRKNFQDIKDTPTPKVIMGMMNNAGWKLVTRKLGREKRLPTILEEVLHSRVLSCFLVIYTWQGRLARLHIWRWTKTTGSNTFF